VIIKNYKPSKESIDACDRACKRIFRYDKRRLTCPLTGVDILVGQDDSIGVMLDERPDYMSTVAFAPDIMARFRAYIQSSELPIVLDLESCTNLDFQFVLAYTFVYASRGYDFYQWAQQAINVEQLARQYRIIWTDDWFRNELPFDNRICHTFEVDYLELAKLFWVLADRDKPTKRLHLYQFTHRTVHNEILYTHIYEPHEKDRLLPDDGRPLYRYNADNLLLMYGGRLADSKFIQIPDGNLDGWLRDLVHQYFSTTKKLQLSSMIGLQEFKTALGWYVFKLEHHEREE